jgi:hypothetical protein
MKILFVDYIWITFILIVNVLFFIRKGILFKHGHRVAVFFGTRDSMLFRKVAESQDSISRRKFYNAINLAIPILFILAAVICLLVHGPWQEGS